MIDSWQSEMIETSQPADKVGTVGRRGQEVSVCDHGAAAALLSSVKLVFAAWLVGSTRACMARVDFESEPIDDNG